MSIRKAIIRVDASQTLGFGHFYRCLNLSRQLASKGFLVVFASFELPSTLKNLCSKNNFDYLELKSFDDWESIDIYLGKKKSLLVIDHYSLGSDFESHFYNKHIIVTIDDLADREHLSHILIDQNYIDKYKSRYEGLIPKECKTLLGPEYCILDNNFKRHRPSSYEKINKVEVVLLFFGGTDPMLASLDVVDFIRKRKINDFRFKLVIGNSFEKLKSLINMANETINLELIIQTEEMYKVINECDIYLGAGGSITWERMALGKSGVVFDVADNQKSGCQMLSFNNYCRYLGTYDPEKIPDYFSEIRKLRSDLESLNVMSKGCYDFINTEGSSKIISEINKLF